MKKLIPLLLIALFLVSCEKEPDLSKVQNDYVIYTQYDKDSNFSKGNTFYIADSVLLIGNKDKGITFLNNSTSDFIIDTYTNQMISRGYTPSENKEDATYGLQISYIESTYYYVNNSSWWSDYPWYWTPSYWWPWYTGYWYYPFPFIYSYTSGSLIAEMIDLTTISINMTNQKPRIIWNNYITDIDIPSTSKIKLANAISQAFTQSPYISYK